MIFIDLIAREVDCFSKQPFMSETTVAIVPPVSSLSESMKSACSDEMVRFLQHNLKVTLTAPNVVFVLMLKQKVL